ncbi:MAG: F-type H+-transporting ATPase subunit b, partial [bacterium]
PDIGFHALHIFLLLALLFVVGRRPIGDALKNRALGIRKELVDSARERDEARQANEELIARLGKFERELETMRATANTEAKKDAARLVVRAETEAKRIAESSERSISEEIRRAKATLRKEAVDLAVELAETILSKEVEADDQRRLARQFLDTLTTDGDSAHG